ncbi:cytochrome c oxidase subunit II [Paracrocinitomix mangrovi]|uniref:cytochrome c oxidase subunit II n=1 Tax=Paracrocinitomix mangrovi TaxID=2862509 RepID=UPI001EDB2698|nr:cytochrome c oxidase subunit II [Paracrocinitomix mangrovi]UKN00875.1 cytochrome c oxidase subunit II [Paracrocinitomix mangrovi]
MGMKLIVLVVIVLAVIAVAQIMRVYELSSKLKGHREEDIDLKTNNINAGLMLVFVTIFFGSLLYMIYLYGSGAMPPAASEHGVDVDWLYNINWIIVFAVYFGTNGLLFWFSYKYSYHPDRKAYYFPHDNKLEMIWTIVPAAALAVIITLGLMVWNKITGAPSDDAVVVEVYAEQFKWTIRYSGDDNQLGYSDYKLVNAENPLGVITEEFVDKRIEEIKGDIDADQLTLDNFRSNTAEVGLSKANEYKLEHNIEKMGRIKTRIETMKGSMNDSIYSKAGDDYISKTALFLVKGQEYQFIFRSRDVIHSAYFPHFRAQMNCVPGERTKLKLKPIMTTAEMQKEIKDPDFSYILMCNKICGASHFNMYLPVIVGTQEEFEAWKADPINYAPVVDVAEEGDAGSDELEADDASVEDGTENAEDAGNGEGEPTH